MTLFKNKYRVESARLKGYDYSSDGAYFITICVKNMECVLGEINGGKMRLSEIGKIVVNEWEKTGKIRKNIILDEWVVMPNHIHGILVVNNDHICIRRDVLSKRLYEYRGNHPEMSSISPIPNSISTVIRFFKRQTIIRGRKILPDFSWQSRFYDRIIRNQSELNRIRTYIQYNSARWDRDRDNLDSLWV